MVRVRSVTGGIVASALIAFAIASPVEAVDNDMDLMSADAKRDDRRLVALIALAAALFVVAVDAGQQPPVQTPDSGFRFKSGVELINVAAMVFDASGRFVPGLVKEDFLVFEDGVGQPLTHFSAERVPVSLGIVLDTSGSMAGEKIRAARTALDRFLYDLLDQRDEIFLYRFSDRPVLVQKWTTDRSLLNQALGRIVADGSTAMYDAVAQAVDLTTTGQNRKKALVLLSDGNDTTSKTSLRDVKQRIRESEALVYAIGIDCEVDASRRLQKSQFQRRSPFPRPFPLPPGPRGRPMPPQPRPLPPQGRTWTRGCSDPVEIGRASCRERVSYSV